MLVFRYAVSDPSKLEARQQFYDEHKAHIRNAPFRVVSSGPAFHSEGNETAAALLIAEVSSVLELEAFSKQDPFFINKVYSDVTILE